MNETATVFPGVIARVGNSLGVRLPLKMLTKAEIYEETADKLGRDCRIPIDIIVNKNEIIIRKAVPKTIDYYLEGYEKDSDRYDWGELNEPKGREVW